MRAPLGGLFRHVADLAGAQAARGHDVGIVADAEQVSAQAEARLAQLASDLAFGVTRIPMSRQLGFSDITACRAVSALAARCEIEVLHGHGAKGGAYARLATGDGRIRVYTPHGGSLHYSPRSPVGFTYLMLERILMARTELLLFESAYARGVFQSRIGTPSARVQVIHNGVADAEFAPITPDADATDLLFVGELRMLKGVDVLIEAIARLNEAGAAVTATIVGDGPDAARFKAQAAEHAPAEQIRFVGPMPARAAFAKGRILVVPSRAESLPYIVLEAAAAGIPIVATAVGGIPEIFGTDAACLVPAGDAAALATVLKRWLDDPALASDTSKRLQATVRKSFSVDAMVTAILTAYAEALPSR